MAYACGITLEVSTHSRPKAAGCHLNGTATTDQLVSTHSRPKAAGNITKFSVSPTRGFNTQPPEGGWGRINQPSFSNSTFQHTAARRRLAEHHKIFGLAYTRFQHTAARRRLGDTEPTDKAKRIVSTHSRPKAAGAVGAIPRVCVTVSTHSRPKAAGYG